MKGKAVEEVKLQNLEATCSVYMMRQLETTSILVLFCRRNNI